MKKHLITQLCAVLLTAATALPAAGQIAGGEQDNTSFGGTAAEFLLLGAGARGTALGGAYAALATDVSALYYNAAGIAQIGGPGAMVSTYDYIAETRYTWVGLAFPLPGGTRAIGVSGATFGFSDQPVYTIDNPEGDGRVYSVAETYFAGTYAQNFSDRFSAGMSLKFVSDKLGDVRANGFAVDFGANFHATIGERPIRAGFVIQNLGSTLKHDGAALDVGTTRPPPPGTPEVPQEPQAGRLRASPWTMPILFRVSVAFDVLTQGVNRVTVLSEFTQSNNNKPAAGGGLEWAVSNIGNSGFSLAARGSYTLQPDASLCPTGLGTQFSCDSFGKDGIAVGGGVGYGRGDWKLGFDYAYRDMGLLGGTNFLSLSVGW